MMKSEALFDALKQLAEKLGITVSEQNFKRTGVRAKGGFCIVKGKPLFIIEKRMPLAEKVEMLTEHLTELPTEDLYLVPALREHLQRARKGKQGASKPLMDLLDKS